MLRKHLSNCSSQIALGQSIEYSEHCDCAVQFIFKVKMNGNINIQMFMSSFTCRDL